MNDAVQYELGPVTRYMKAEARVEELEAEIAKVREERAPELAERLRLILSGEQPASQDFLIQSVHELSVAYGEQKHKARDAEAELKRMQDMSAYAFELGSQLKFLTTAVCGLLKSDYTNIKGSPEWESVYQAFEKSKTLLERSTV